jgi:predicted alpha/beta-hydrolase family hydrolase
MGEHLPVPGSGEITTGFSFKAGKAGAVSALLVHPDNCVATVVFGHGAGANMRHRHMEHIAASLARAGIATLRFNFPYMEAGRRRTDSKAVCIETIGGALGVAVSRNLDPLYLGGHSFGGRMASHFAAEADTGISGLIYYSFPLHPAGKPATSRADHLYGLAAPQLFLSGTRDRLAEPGLLEGVVASLQNARLHRLDTADHGFGILKRSRQSPEDPYTEAARVVADFIR